MNHVIRRIDMKSGVITTLAGTGKAGFAGDDGPVRHAQFNQPHSIQFDPAGDLYVCDILNHRIRKIDMKTKLHYHLGRHGEAKPTPDAPPSPAPRSSAPARSTLTPPATPTSPSARATRSSAWMPRPKPSITSPAPARRGADPGNNGPAKSATLSGPKGLSLSPDAKRLYLADTESHTIRMIDLTKGTISQIAGTTHKADGPDGDPLKCALARPHGVFCDKDNTLYIADSENHRIRTLPPPRAMTRFPLSCPV